MAGGIVQEIRVMPPVAFTRRHDRIVFEIQGQDRGNWLHNLTTHQIKALSPGQGNYCFFLNVQGRILFDAYVWIRQSSIWLDLDSNFQEVAEKHLSKYVIVEDVRLRKCDGNLVRFALLGTECKSWLAAAGKPQVANLPFSESLELEWFGTQVLAVRTDHFGVPAWDLVVTEGSDEAILNSLDPLPEVAMDTLDVLRIEHGVPWPGREITSEYLPAETGQLRRAVSFNKGCYLGQEVVERMRSRDVVARKLVGLKLEGGLVPPSGSSLVDDTDKPCGNVTSACHSSRLHRVIALGYVKAAMAEPGRRLKVSVGTEGVVAEVAPLPFVPTED